MWDISNSSHRLNLEDNSQKENNKEESKQEENKLSNVPLTPDIINGYIFKINKLIKPEMADKIKKQIEKLKKEGKQRITYKNILAKIKEENKEFKEESEKFEFQLVRVFQNIEEHFGHSSPNVTSIGTLANDAFMYEGKDFSVCIEEELSRSNTDLHSQIKNKNFKWKWISNGFIGYCDSEAVFVKIKANIKETEEKLFDPILNDNNKWKIMKVDVDEKSWKVIKIDFVLESPELKIENVFECKNGSRVVFQISKWDTREHMFVVWDLENNKEIWNYSTEGDFRFVQGVSSETGYLLTAKAYVNLDNGIANPFFDYDFISSNREFKLVTSWGFKVNSKGNLLYNINRGYYFGLWKHYIKINILENSIPIKVQRR